MTLPIALEAKSWGIECETLFLLFFFFKFYFIFKLILLGCYAWLVKVQLRAWKFGED